MNSFLSSIPSFLSIVPDYRPKQISDKIAPKCSVVYFPVEVMRLPGTKERRGNVQAKNVTNEASEFCTKGREEWSESDTSCVSSVQLSQCESVLHILWPHRW